MNLGWPVGAKTIASIGVDGRPRSLEPVVPEMITSPVTFGL